MHNQRIFIALMLSAAILISAMAPAAMAQKAAPGDWTVVQSLAPDQEIVISLKDGREVKGKFLDAGANELSITRKGKHESFPKDNISLIHQVKGKAQKGLFALIGAGVGAGTGVAIGSAKNSPPVDDGGIYPVMGAMLGAGIGAAGGFIFGQTRRNRELVYQAR